MMYNGVMSDKTVVAYIRVSTLLNQDPNVQITSIREFARQRDFKLVGEYVDEGISGAREKRPSLDRLIVDARMGKFKILVVTGIDRLGRSTKHLLNFLDEMNHYGVSLISIREQLDFSTPTGQMALTMLSAVATLERQLISERIKTALAARKITARDTGSGWRCGRPRKVTDDIADSVVELRRQGLSFREIGKRLGISHMAAYRLKKDR
jgi:DNA invertase Pin-like site-specific DNA recombinase